MKKNNLIIASKLLGDFNSFIDKRSAVFLSWSGEMLDRVLEWHFDMWKKEYEYLGQDKKLDEWAMYGELSRTLDSIFKQIEINALKERSAFTFFDKLKKHAEKYKMASVSSRSYVEYLFDTFYQVYFQKIHDAPERFNIWNHYFLGEWKITKSNLQDKENIISKISLKNFFNWASDKIWYAREERDFTLDDVASNLFPEVNPILWAKILIVFFSRPGEEQLRLIIEKPWNFGFIGRVKVYSGPHYEDEKGKIDKDEEINTFDLSYLLFKEQFSKIKLESYIKSLEQLSYPEKSMEESKKLRLQKLFTKMLDFVKSTEPSKHSPGAGLNGVPGT